MLMLAADSFTKFISIYRPLKIFNKDTAIQRLKATYMTVGACTIFGLFCAAAPLFGWSYYSLEGALTSCSVEWADRSFNVVSYNVFIFFITFFIPLLVIVFCNIGIYVLAKKFRKHRDQHVDLILLSYIALFIFSWTPYAVVSFYAAFLGNDLSPLAGTLPAMFAKSEFVWSSLIFIWSNRKVRCELKQYCHGLLKKASLKLSSNQKLLCDMNTKEIEVFTSGKGVDERTHKKSTQNDRKKLQKQNARADSMTTPQFPEPFFANDPEYMKGFKALLSECKLKYETFNLNFMVERIKRLKRRENSIMLFNDRLKQDLALIVKKSGPTATVHGHDTRDQMKQQQQQQNDNSSGLNNEMPSIHSSFTTTAQFPPPSISFSYNLRSTSSLLLSSSFSSSSTFISSSSKIKTKKNNNYNTSSSSSLLKRTLKHSFINSLNNQK